MEMSLYNRITPNKPVEDIYTYTGGEKKRSRDSK